MPKTEYRKLIEQRPNLFQDHPSLHIITDEAEIQAFEQESGRIIGICYESPYNMVVVDLVENQVGDRFAYERVVPACPNKAVAMLATYEGRIVLLHQFRHALRRHQYAIPRGFGSPGCTPEQNAVKELQEELGCEVLFTEYLGVIVADSGLSGNEVSVFHCDISRPVEKVGYEGIGNLLLVTPDEFEGMVRAGRIDDGFTLGAYALMGSKKKNHR